MIKLTNILNELNINRPITLAQLERWRNEIEASNDPTTKRHLALKCAESVLFIFEREHPNDPRPRNAINAVKTYLNDPSAENWQKCLEAADAADAAAYAAYAIITSYYVADAAAYATYAAATAADYYAIYAANSAIAAFKKYNKLNELNVNNPNITAEKVYKYFSRNFIFGADYWNEYIEICTPYCEKYNIVENWIGPLEEFQQLSSSDLNRLYREMRTLILKYVGTEIL